ncbi:MAG: TetR/AcrR family transcriptional regulator [Clostridiaceae bacterium]|nr:TetR/AcrR family transcriptional regulator [Clostridiaceae bacterium]
MLQPKEYASKEIDLFEGIVKLLNEGRSVHDLKVADIASAAGMGKGTAYEYFSSKEEIIREAIRYHICLEFGAFSKFVSQSEGLVSILERSMDYIVDMINNRFSSLLVMALSLNFSDIRRLTCEDGSLIPAIEQGIRGQMKIILDVGVKEKLISPSVTPEECYLVLGGIFSAFSNEVRFLLGKDRMVFDGPGIIDQRKAGTDEEVNKKIEHLRETVIRLVLKALA